MELRHPGFHSTKVREKLNSTTTASLFATTQSSSSPTTPKVTLLSGMQVLPVVIRLKDAHKSLVPVTGLSPGSYVATIHIVSRSADDGEWEKEDDVPIEIHLLVTEKPAVKIQNIKLNHDKDGVHFAASIDTIHNKLFIDKDNIYLSTDGK